MTITGGHPVSVTCSVRSDESIPAAERKLHYYKALQTTSNFDVNTAVEFFNELCDRVPVGHTSRSSVIETRLEADPCASITNKMGRMKKCRMRRGGTDSQHCTNRFPAHNHLSGIVPGWRAYPCKVRFTVFIPDDLEKAPFIAFTSHGKHVHPPPPATKTPTEVLKELAAVVERAKEPGLTSGMLPETC